MVFDVGGVLLRTEDRRPRTMLADAFGMTYEQLDHLVFNSSSGLAAQRGERTAGEHWEWVRRQLDLNRDEIGPVRDTFFSGDVLDAGLLEFVGGLRDRFKLAILSNALDDARALLTGRYGLGEIFDPIVISAEEKVMKPDPEIYQITLRKCGAAPEETVFVDDFPHNIAAAQALGIRTIWFRNRDQAMAELTTLLGES